MKQIELSERKARAIEDLRDLGAEIADVISQLEKSDEAYYSNSSLASIVEAFGMTWGVGTDPRDGQQRFTAYFKK